jgi:hypothetical protein
LVAVRSGGSTTMRLRGESQDARRVRVLRDSLIRLDVAYHDAEDYAQEAWLRAQDPSVAFDSDEHWLHWGTEGRVAASGGRHGVARRRDRSTDTRSGRPVAVSQNVPPCCTC